MGDKIPLIVVAGPTASGKTALAVKLALAFQGEVISADSMQVYEGMEIATAKPTQEEMRGVPHHLIGVVPQGESFSLARYTAMAHAAAADIHTRGRLPILCGGTGLYMQAVTENLTLTQGAFSRGAEGSWEELHNIDPTAALKIHPNDTKRIARALDLFRTTGITLTQQNAQSRMNPTPYNGLMLFLNAQLRQNLYDRIDRRVDQMVSQGLIDEAAAWRQNKTDTAAQTIGYKELEPYFTGQCSLEAALEHLKRETRRYAKRQLSWFRRRAKEWNERNPGSCIELMIENEYMTKQALTAVNNHIR